ncbi:MAG: DNA polymerase III subunit delta [Planctomycetota bacterium]
MSAVILILGPDRFLSRNATKDVLSKHPDLDVNRLDGSATAVGRVLDEVRTPTLLGGRRAVVVDNAGDLLEGESLMAVADYAEAPAKGALLILVANRLDGRLKAAKRLKAASRTLLCQPPPMRQVEGWIQNHGREALGLQVVPRAAQALRARVGEDLGSLDAALRRLADQIAPRLRLEADDVLETTQGHRSPALFEAGNAIEARDLRAALKAVRACFREGIRFPDKTITDARAVGPIVLGNLHKTHLKLLRFHLLRAEGLSRDDAAKKIGVSPQAARFFLSRAGQHDAGTLAARHTHFLAADKALKSDGDPRLTVEGLVLSILA